MGETIRLTAADGHEFDAYRAEPEGEAKGAVVVIQEIFGVNGHIRDVTDSYAADGYLAIAPAIFDRFERGIELDYTPEGIAAGREFKAQGNDNLEDITIPSKHTNVLEGMPEGPPKNVGQLYYLFGEAIRGQQSSYQPSIPRWSCTG